MIHSMANRVKAKCILLFEYLTQLEKMQKSLKVWNFRNKAFTIFWIKVLSLIKLQARREKNLCLWVPCSCVLTHANPVTLWPIFFLAWHSSSALTCFFLFKLFLGRLPFFFGHHPFFFSGRLSFFLWSSSISFWLSSKNFIGRLPFKKHEVVFNFNFFWGLPFLF
jgi:hypothetical protein